MAQQWFTASDSFRQIFIRDSGMFVAPNVQAIQAPTGAAQTINITGMVVRTAPAGACTNTILAAGSFDGQIIIVTNESTVVANSITFNTAVATGLVLTDATPDAIVIKAASAAMFVWAASLTAWIHVAPFAG